MTDAVNGPGIGLAGAVFITQERRIEDKSRMLGLWLEIAVPIWIHRFESEGWTPERRIEAAQRAAALIGERADLLIREPTKREHHDTRAELLNAIAAGVAAMAYCPGGVTVFGKTFAANDAAGTPSAEARESADALDRAIATWMDAVDTSKEVHGG